MKTATRFTKKAVLDEVKELRRKMSYYLGSPMDRLYTEFKAAYPGETCEKTTPGARAYMVHRLFISATFYMTNVLNLE